LGLLDTLLNKEKKLLEKSKKELARVDSLEKSGRSSEALAELEKTSSMLKENMIFIGKMRLDFSPVFSDLGKKFLEFDRAQMAQDAAKVSLQLDPKNPVAMVVDGRSAMRLGNVKEALITLSSAVAVFSKSEDLWSALGDAQESSGDISSSIESYKRAIDINPQVVEYYEKILAHTPQDTDMIRRKGTALAKLQRYDDSVRTFQAGLAMDPKNKDP
jgi:tetratricopeptide (TPR) repeat protein